MRSEEFLKQFLWGREKKQKVVIEGETLIEWSYRLPLAVRVLAIAVPVGLLMGYYALKYFRRVKFAPLDVVVTLSLLLFGSRIAASSGKYALTTVGVYGMLSGNWRSLGRWEEFKSCRREEESIILEKRKGFSRLVKLRCSEKERMLAVLGLANEQISKRRWR
ncbi:MAG: hypothetical protein ACE5JA_00930 [bacterium]